MANLKPIDEQTVYKMAKIHCTNIEIAEIFGVNESTIRNRFSEILLKARSVGKRTLRRAQWATALKGNVTMQIWLGKQMLGQKETMEVSVEGLVEKELDFIGMPSNKSTRRFKKYTSN